MAKPKFFVQTKNLARVTKIFAPLHGLTQRDLIGFRINTMLETLILQGFIIPKPVEPAMILRRLRELAQFLQITLANGKGRGTSPNKILIVGKARRILAILQNLSDGDFGSHKNWVKIKKLWYFILIFSIISFGIRKIQHGWFGECARLPNRGTAKGKLPVRV